MGNEKPIRNEVLEVLRDHPFLSRRQIELYLGCPERTVRNGLRELKARKWAWQANARQPWMHSRCLYAPTKAGVEFLAQNSSTPLAEYSLGTGLYAARLRRLVLTMERIFQLRTFFLWLSLVKGSEDWRWRAIQWDVEVGKLFSAKGRAVWIPFHGAALMQRGSERSPSTLFKVTHVVSEANPSAKSKDGRWAFVVVEFDLSRVAVESDRERLHQFVASQDDPRFWGKDKEHFFPVLLVIAQDELRLQDYYNILRSAALSRQLPMPRAYLTTFGAMLSLRDDNTRPIWYSTISGRRTSLLSDTEGIATPLPEQALWRKMPLHQMGGLGADADVQNIGVTSALPTDFGASVTPELSASNASTQDSADVLAQIALSLKPLEKRLLDEIAAHPLLTRNDLVLLLQATLRRVRPELARMTTWQLIEVHDGRYLIAPKGQQYLAHTAGFGNAVRRYARARGWGKGFDVLVRHWEHTKEENKFFLHLAKIALDWGHTLTWLYELESRLYYETGQRRHSFLPDGRGSYLAGDACYEFTVEIDRSRASQERLRLKLAEYEACTSSNVLRSEGIELLRLLVLTNSWERVETWRRAAQNVRVRFPIFATTFDRLYASRADAPIWLQGDLTVSEPATSTRKVHCFECFANQE